MDLDYLSASDGVGPASPATVTVGRSAAATTIEVDGVTNWPDKFIATYGVYNATTEKLEVASIRVFMGHLDGTDVIIDEFAPGFVDNGNSIGDRIYVKPATLFADMLVDFLKVAHDTDGNLKDSIITDLTSDILTGVGTLTNKRIQSRVYSTATTTTLAPDLTNYNVYDVTALASALAISAPLGTPVNGEVMVIRLKDNGSARAITWNSVFVGIGDSLLSTTVAGKWTYINAMYNSASSKWDVLPAITQV